MLSGTLEARKTHRMGPTVWLELGPIPMEKRSKVEMTACSARSEVFPPEEDGAWSGTRDEDCRVTANPVKR